MSRQEPDFLEAAGLKMIKRRGRTRARSSSPAFTMRTARRPASIRDASATFDVLAPMAGVITKRGANPGLNINTATPLFTVVDLATVWV